MPSQFRAKCHKHDDDVCLQGALVVLQYLSLSFRIINYPMSLLYALVLFGAIRGNHLWLRASHIKIGKVLNWKFFTSEYLYFNLINDA